MYMLYCGVCVIKMFGNIRIIYNVNKEQISLIRIEKKRETQIKNGIGPELLKYLLQYSGTEASEWTAKLRKIRKNFTRYSCDVSKRDPVKEYIECFF